MSAVLVQKTTLEQRPSETLRAIYLKLIGIPQHLRFSLPSHIL